jgi:hypothetical protein
MYGKELSSEIVTTNYFIDASFMVDIILIFNTAYEDESTLKIITDRKKIAAFYLKGWFLVDLLSILPFDLSEVNGINKMMRFGRLSKLYKLIKLGRLTRMVKLAKQKNKFIKYL